MGVFCTPCTPPNEGLIWWDYLWKKNNFLTPYFFSVPQVKSENLFGKDHTRKHQRACYVWFLNIWSADRWDLPSKLFDPIVVVVLTSIDFLMRCETQFLVIVRPKCKCKASYVWIYRIKIEKGIKIFPFQKLRFKTLFNYMTVCRLVDWLFHIKSG